MPIALREAEIVWEGPLASGAGTLTSGSGALSELAGDVGVADRAGGRQDEPRGAHRGRARQLLRDGALARARREQDAAGARDGERRLHPRRGGGRAAHHDGRAHACAHRCPGSRPPISSAWSNGRPISARSPTRCAATSRSTCRADRGRRGERTQPRGSAPAGSTSPWPHSRQEAETEDIVHALRSYGVLTRARLLDICGAAHWSIGRGASPRARRTLRRADRPG